MTRNIPVVNEGTYLDSIYQALQQPSRPDGGRAWTGSPPKRLHHAREFVANGDDPRGAASLTELSELALPTRSPSFCCEVPHRLTGIPAATLATQEPSPAACGGSHADGILGRSTGRGEADPVRLGHCLGAGNASSNGRANLAKSPIISSSAVRRHP